MAEEKRPRVGLAVILMREDKVLIGRRKNIRGDGLWAFPGGHLDYGETFRDCARREVAEETGLTNIAIKPRVYAAINDIMPNDDKHYVILFMKADYLGGEPKNMEPDKCEGWEWHSWASLPRPLFHGIQSLVNLGYNPFKD